MNRADVNLQQDNGARHRFCKLFLRLHRVAYVVAALAVVAGCPAEKSMSDVAVSQTGNVSDSVNEPNGLGDRPCRADCVGRECGSDLCGGSCGTCGADETCLNGGLCEPDENEVACTDTCEGLGHQCGEVCGDSCGTCAGAQENCEQGQCVCQPMCTGRTCGDADGCGGFCTPCPVDVNCVDCAFKLEVVERTEQDGLLTHITLALNFKPSDGISLPVMADVQLKVGGPVTMDRIGLGQALLDAGKEPLTHPHTGASYQRIDAQTYRFILLSTQNTSEIGGGHWMSLRFAIGDTASEGPATFELVPHDQILAPITANALDYSEIENQIVVWPEVSNAQ